jgi:hypothetical protein
VQHRAVQVGDQREHLVPADVHAEQQARAGVEAVAPGRAAHLARGRFDLGHPAPVEQLAHHVLGRGAGQADLLRQLGQRQERIVPQRSDRAVRVELAEAGEIPAGEMRGQRVPLAYGGPGAFNGVLVNLLEGTPCLR